MKYFLVAFFVFGSSLTLGAVRVNSEGGVVLGDDGGPTLTFETWLSHPNTTGGEGMPFNTLSVEPRNVGSTRDPAWKPQVNQVDDKTIEVRAGGALYDLHRVVRDEGARVVVRDTITNITDNDIGIRIDHQFKVDSDVTSWHLNGRKMPLEQGRCEEHPTAYIETPRGNVGVLFADDVMRNQVHLRLEQSDRRLDAATTRFGLAARRSYTFETIIYRDLSGFYDLVNRVRADWNVNFTLDGPAGFFSLLRGPWLEMKDNPEKIKAYFDRKKLSVILVTPWFLYDDGYLHDREQFKTLVTDAMSQIRAVHPAIRFVACLEPSIEWAPRSLFAGTLPDDFGFGRDKGHRLKSVSPEATAALDQTPWADSLWRDFDGNAIINTSDYMKHPDDWPAVDQVVGLQLFPVAGNYRDRQFRERVDFLIDQCGFDGIYFDLFNYDGDTSGETWDGHTVELDARGNIVRKYALLALHTADARSAWVNELLARGKVVATNLKPNESRTQAQPVIGFNEAWSSFTEADGRPDAPDAIDCQLSAPLALGLFTPDQSRAAELTMKCVMAYLRYGVLYSHYNLDIPETGDGAGDYGPINHMFPFTPVELNEGWVKGQERLIGCVSFTTQWQHAGQPTVLCFDNRGRSIDPGDRVKLEPAGDGQWRISAQIDDWNEFVVIE